MLGIEWIYNLKITADLYVHYLFAALSAMICFYLQPLWLVAMRVLRWVPVYPLKFMIVSGARLSNATLSHCYQSSAYQSPATTMTSNWLQPLGPRSQNEFQENKAKTPSHRKRKLRDGIESSNNKSLVETKNAMEIGFLIGEVVNCK